VAAADRLAHALTWVVLAVALLAGLHAGDGWVAIAVLVATCPCALALAAPVALTQAAGDLLAHGMALTRSSALETLAAATDVVLDKTGTLTAGEFAIAQLQLLGSAGEAACRALAGALEASSRHPLARAFAHSGAARADAVRNVPGRGVEATVDGRCLRIGTEDFCAELAPAPPPAAQGPAQSPAHTPVWLADERGWLAVFLLEDALRGEAAGALAELRRAALRIHLLSGDHAGAVGAVAGRLGIETWRGGALPQDKFDYVARLQREGRVVAMIGDGLNDTPVLARADVSFAPGSGADAAQLQADCVLLDGSLGGIPQALSIARRTMRIVRQNFAWALAYNAFALPLAAAGWIGPREAAIGMAASSFIVVLNAMRAGGASRGKDAWKASPSSSPSPSPSYS
jgi:Cu2+-exporting ATPase